MTAAELLAECDARRIDLQAHGGQLDIDAPAGELTPEILQALRIRKADLLKLLASGSDRPPDFQPHGDGDAAGPVALQPRPVAVPKTWPPVVPSGIIAAPVIICSDCGRLRVVPGQPGRPSGLCFGCWSIQGKAGER